MKIKEKIILAIILIIQTIIFVIAGINKSYIHMDEAYSYGLMNYDKINITDNQDFLNNWHDKDYFLDYWIFITVFSNRNSIFCLHIWHCKTHIWRMGRALIPGFHAIARP